MDVPEGRSCLLVSLLLKSKNLPRFNSSLGWMISHACLSICRSKVKYFFILSEFFFSSVAEFLPCFLARWIFSTPPGGGAFGQNIYPCHNHLHEIFHFTKFVLLKLKSKKNKKIPPGLMKIFFWYLWNVYNSKLPLIVRMRLRTMVAAYSTLT